MKTTPCRERPHGAVFQLGMTALYSILSLGGTAAMAQQSSNADGAAQAQNRYSLVLEEVLVTAQKREETQMSVPIAVNTFTAQDIINTGALNIELIDDFMPGVEFGNTSSNQSTQMGVSIRGVRSPNISSGGDPSVATFYDGSYMPRAVTTIPFTDIERIEVLKGPQGTLFGRNATAGVVNIIPVKPEDEFNGFARARLGNYNLVDFEGMVNVPINDQLAARANIFHHQRDAIFNNVGIGDDLREENFTAARLVLQYEPTADTRLQLAADIEDRDENTNYSIGVSKYAVSTDPFNSDVANDVPDRDEKRDMYGVSLQADHDFNERLSVFGIVSYREWETFNKQDEDGTAAPRRYLDTNNIEDSDIWYSEIRFNFVGDNLDVIVGGNYSSEDVSQRTDIGLLADSYMQFISLDLLPEVGFPSDPDVHAWDPDVLGNEDEDFYLAASALAGSFFDPPLAGIAVLPPSFAGTYFNESMLNTGQFINWGIFADATYQFNESIRLIAGLRYSYDDKEYSWQTFDQNIDWPFAPARVAFDPAETGAAPEDFFNKFEDDESWGQTTGRAVVEWDFMDSAMTYFSYATGYKAGGFDGQVFSAFVAGPFDPEEMTSYEWGLKGDFFEDTVRVEFAAFYHELDNRQEQESVKDSPDDPTAQPRVVSSDEETTGWEVIAQWQVMDTLRLSGLTTMRETERIQQPFFDAEGEPAGGVKENLKADLDYTLSLDWTPAIPVGLLLVHVDFIFNEAEDDTLEPIFTTGEWYFQDRELLNARIAWTNDAQDIEVAVWGRNLLDKEYADNPGGFVADTLGAYRTNVEDPLTFGVDLRYAF